MNQFSHLERWIAQLLRRFPRARATLKRTYQAFNFAVYGERGFTCAIHPRARLITPSQAIDAPEPERDTSEFFGYFDASPWSPEERFYAVHHVRDRACTDADIVVYDFERKERRIIGRTIAWTWQQGAMPRWLTQDNSSYLAFNTLEDGVLGTRISLPDGTQHRFLELPLQAVNPAFREIYSINYLRLRRNGTEYGYSINASNLSADQPDNEDGVWSVDYVAGTIRLIVSLERLRQLTYQTSCNWINHEINHISVAPDGRHFVFIHRFRDSRGQHSHLILASRTGEELRILLKEMVSHYTWLSSTLLLAWARTPRSGERYYVIDIEHEIQVFPSQSANRWGDGHPTFHSSHGWIATDSYPDRKRQQHLMLLRYDENVSPLDLGSFFLPLQFNGSKRIDLHPRWAPSGRWLSIDSGCFGKRRNYLIDVSEIVAT